MKKLFPLLIAFTLLFSFPLPTFAAESNDRQQNTSFEISLEEALALADPADITVQNGITTIPVKLDISEEVYTEVVIKVKFYIRFLIIRINTILSNILKYRKTLILPRIYHD
ncbi:MAG: hypothetical protein ACLVB0_12470 [Fusicatenibacter saccharivorans]